jgi:DNA-binding transcriptional MocR family regulator
MTNVQHQRRLDLIELDWGHPDPALLPVDDLRRASTAALDRFGAEALAYGPNAGPGPLLDWLRARIEQREGQAVRADEIVLTAGASEAIHQLAVLNTRPGDVALVESPTYHLAARILSDLGLELITVLTDTDGLRIDALKDRLADLKRAGRPPRLLYTIPTFHNPTGRSLSAERRRSLIELAVDERLLIVEDDAYRELVYEGEAPPSLWSRAPVGTVARVGSFAKTLAPGLRLGWITADAARVGRLVDGGLRTSGGGMNHFMALVVAALCADGGFEPNVERLRIAYRTRRDALVEALAEFMPAGASWARPAGGFFVWVSLPAGCDAAGLLPRAQTLGVVYHPGTRFCLDGAGRDAMRLAFSFYGPAALAEGARRLGQALYGA